MERAKRWIRAVTLISRLPGRPILSQIGDIFTSGRNSEFLETVGTAYGKYGPISRCSFYGYPTILLSEPKHMQLIYKSSKQLDKELLYNLLHSVVGDGLVTSSGNVWKTHRKFTQTYFSRNTLEESIPTFLKHSQILLKSLQNVEKIRISSSINKYMMDVMHEIILGFTVNDQSTTSKSPFADVIESINERLAKPWLMMDFLYKRTETYKIETLQRKARHKFVSEILVKKEKEEYKTSPRSFLEFMVEKSKHVNDFNKEDIINEACTFLISAQETTAVTLVYCLFYLAKHQDIQDKVIDELNNIFVQSSEINISTINSMQYLGQCIKEAMRLNPALPVAARKLSEDVKLDDYVIPAGCNVLMSTYTAHRLPQYYNNPEKFDPDRFSVVRQDKSNSIAYMPFSSGPRNCIGYRLAMLGMKITLSALLKRYRIYLVPGCNQLTLKYSVVTKAKGGVWLALEPRNPIN